MSKVGIIYWSSTGNTEAMAQAGRYGCRSLQQEGCLPHRSHGNHR